MVIAAHFELSPDQSGPDQTGPDQAGSARDPRRMLRLEAQGLTAAGDPARVLVHNISANGLLLESEISLAAGERIDIDLPHGASSARVIWTSGSYFGCQFDAPISTAALSAAQLRSEVVVDSDAAGPIGAPAGPSFGQWLQGLRKVRGLTLAQLAAQVGVSKPTVWAWEHGKARPVAARMAALAQALDVPAPEMLLGRRTPILSDLISSAKDQIAGVLGVTPDKVRIVVDL